MIARVIARIQASHIVEPLYPAMRNSVPERTSLDFEEIRSYWPPHLTHRLFLNYTLIITAEADDHISLSD